MELQQVNREVTTSGLMETNAFKIASNAKSFKVISDSLYTNKPLAVLREYLNNAWDSHIDANNTDTPVYLHLPTLLEPWLEIKDYGVGLDDQQVRSIYTSYFTSTKENSNDYNGCLGLGSKSAFSYTDSFVVVARKDERCRTYSLYLNDSGIPTYSLLADAPTDEPSGVTIKVNIKKHDVETFVKEARNFLEYYMGNVTVNIPDFRYTKTEYSVVSSDGTWSLRKDVNNYRHTSGFARIIMGSVVYPISTSVMDNYLSEEGQRVANMPIDIHVPLGSVSIHPSREGLDYDEHTTSNLSRIFEAIYPNLTDELFREVDQCDTLWEARKKSKEVYNQLPYSLQYNLSSTNFFYKGTEYSYRVRFKDVEASSNIEIGYRESRSLWRDNGEYVNKFSSTSTDITSSKGVIIVDEKASYTQRINEYFINTTDHDDGFWIIVKGAKDTPQSEYDTTLKNLGDPPVVIKVSDMPKITRSGIRTSRGRATKLVTFSPDGFGLSSKTWKNTTVETDDVEVYVELSNYKTTDDERFLQLHSALINIGKCPVVYGVPASTGKTIRKELASNAEVFEDYAVRTITEYLNSLPMSEWVSYFESKLMRKPDWSFNTEYLRDRMKEQQATTHEVYVYLTKLQECDDYNEAPIRNALAVLPDYKKPIDITESSLYNGSTKLEQINTDYPMLQLVERIWYDNHFKYVIIIDYLTTTYLNRTETN